MPVEQEIYTVVETTVGTAERILTVWASSQEEAIKEVKRGCGAEVSSLRSVKGKKFFVAEATGIF